jgi:hypothetical protein
MLAIRVYPGTETPRLMSRTSNVRKAEWDLVRGNHHGQRQLPRDQQAGHKTVPDQGMPKRQKALATQEPSTQDIRLPRRWEQTVRTRSLKFRTSLACKIV